MFNEIMTTKILIYSMNKVTKPIELCSLENLILDTKKFFSNIIEIVIICNSIQLTLTFYRLNLSKQIQIFHYFYTFFQIHFYQHSLIWNLKKSMVHRNLV